MKKLFTSLLAIFFLTAAFAFDPPQMNQDAQNSMTIQIIKEQFQLTKQAIQTINTEKLTNGRYAIEIELTPEATKELQEITAENIDRSINIVWQHHILNTAIIRSPLSGKFQISSFNKETAEAFVKKMQS